MRRDFYSEYFEMEDRHWWFVGRRRILLDVIEADVVAGWADGARRILDVGCGTGTMLGHLASYGSAQGVDMSEEAVRFCRARGLSNVQLGSAEALPFEDEAFDLVTALDVLEHLDDDHAMLTELSRVLRRGGALLLSVPAYRFLWGAQDEISEHRRRYVARDLERRVRAAGLSVQRRSYFNTLLFPVIAGVRVARRLRPGRDELRSDFEMTRPGRLNDFLARLLALEAPIVRAVGLPFGISILLLARRVNGHQAPRSRQASVAAFASGRQPASRDLGVAKPPAAEGAEASDPCSIELPTLIPRLFSATRTLTRHRQVGGHRCRRE